jgi:aminopeptidase N
VYERIEKSLLAIKSFFGVDFPLTKLDVVALPSFSNVKSADNWGLIVFR